MPPKAVEGIRIRRFKALEGQVIKPVPEEHIKDFRFWRAAHLGAVALNFMEGVRVISVRGWRGRNGTKFTDYEAALSEAEEMAGTFRGTPKYQFGSQDHHRFIGLTKSWGISDNFKYPVLLHALGENHYNAKKAVEKDPQSGSKITEKQLDTIGEEASTAVHTPPLTMCMADPFSLQFLREITKKSEFPDQGV